MHWKTLSTQYLSKHQYFTARRDRCEREDGVIVDPYFVVEMPPSATAVAITEDDHVVLIKQYRHAIGEVVLETPGGFIDEDEDFEQGMKRELLEETGYEFSHVEHLGKTAANPGVLNNFTHLFIATGGRKVASQQLDHNEEITIVLAPLDEVIELLMRGQFKQSMHSYCLMLALIKMGRLKFDE